MKTWALSFILLSVGLPGWRWLTHVREHNAAQTRGQAALAGGRAAEAVYYYQQAVALADRRGASPALLLNLAQAQARAGQVNAARLTYAQLLGPAVPALVGSAARQQLAGLLSRQGQVAQALGLLRQALKLNPGNATARYNYELLSQYLNNQQPDNPALPPPADAPASTPKQPAPAKEKEQAKAEGGSAPTPAERAGTDRPGQAPTPNPAAGGGSSGTPQPSASGQPDYQRPNAAPGSGGNGGFRPGAGERQPTPSGTTPGRQRGLDANADAGGPAIGSNPGGRPGTEAATEADLQLQTQRERLKAMNLTPAQAQQLLEALRESEQQYLQQRPRPRQGVAPAPGQPTW